jgi:hypothetical protein
MSTLWKVGIAVAIVIAVLAYLGMNTLSDGG